MQFLPSTAPVESPDDRLRHRLTTANLIIAALARCEIEVFGNNKRVAQLEPMRLGGMWFIPATAGAHGIDVGAPVRGKARLLAGFRGTYQEQQLVRALVGYVREGRPVSALVLAQAMTGSDSRNFVKIEHHFIQILTEFRFTRAFLKPRHVHPKKGPIL